jgi:molybdopterin synthase sulfur carrier subunit
LRLFAAAREAAGTAVDEFPASTLGELLAAATERYGRQFADVLEAARVWVDGDDPADGLATRLADGCEVAVLPPVSGGAAPTGRGAGASGAGLCGEEGIGTRHRLR